MPRLPLDLVVAATGAAITRAAPPVLEGVSHDGRMGPPGGLYVAIRGERLDGHDFVAQAEAAGAAAVLVARGRAEAAVAATRAVAVLEVDDPMLALGRLARAWRTTLPGTVVALTGSVGKTSTKEMLAAIFAAAVGPAAVHKTRGNLNNHLGVPLTLLGMAPEHRYAVVELGMSSLGEIAYLEHLARPDAVLVTRVAGVHLEQLGSIENVARAKGEIYEGRAASGTAWAIAPHGERLLEPSLAHVPPARRRSFGGEGADVAIVEARLEEGATHVRLRTPAGEVSARLPILGVHHASNAATAACAALAVGVGLEAVRVGLDAVAPAQHRMQLLRVEGRTVIDDCYNASPPSVRAALDALASVGEQGARRVAILGDMLELGPGGPAEHAAIGRYAATRANDVIAIGALSRQTAAGAGEALGERALHVDGPEQAAARALALTRPGDVLLVKGSRGMRLERVIEEMQRLAGTEGA
jgi:UDP-N-acetylmuramoyl-tripeptide--D-alanyl-D-alanine ligase